MKEQSEFSRMDEALQSLPMSEREDCAFLAGFWRAGALIISKKLEILEKEMKRGNPNKPNRDRHTL